MNTALPTPQTRVATWGKLRGGVALAGAAVLVAMASGRLEDLGATAIVRAPNAGRPAASVALPGETLVAVGPPAATLSIEIVDAVSPRGTVFVLHGIRDSKRSMVGWAQLLAARGYRAVLVDSRGHGRSSGDALTYGVQESRDLSAVADALAGAGKIAGEIGVLGASYGAATAIEWAGRDERVRAVVAVSPFASLRAVVPGYLPFPLPSSFVNEAIARAGAQGGFDPDLASPLGAIARTRAPTLLVHGSADRKIPVAHAHAIAAAGADHTTLVVVEGAGHDDVMGAPGADLAERAPAWFDAHLARSGPASQ
jgi:pimeloyl-ACP methyl ester carboxylesterase